MNISEKQMLIFFTMVFFIANTFLFVMREIDVEWWLADYQIYNNTQFNIHIKAILFFYLYLAIYYILARFFIRKDSVAISRVNSVKSFCFLVFLYVIQIYLALKEDVGVAGGVGTAPTWSVIFLLFSADGFYFAYALTEKSKSRLVFATLLFITSNVARGWAGFVVPAVLLLTLRRGGITKKEFAYCVGGGFVLLPILFIVRDYFRGGYSYLEVLRDSGFSGAELLTEYSGAAVKLILTRLDFYSHYIGIHDKFQQGLGDNICNPILENVFVKMFLYMQGGLKCQPLGKVLPSELYTFFIDKGTSYSVGSGFCGLPFNDAILYVTPYLFVLILTAWIFLMKIKIKEYSLFVLYFIFVLLFQGWMYQFIYNLLGLIVGIFFMKATVAKKMKPNLFP